MPVRHDTINNCNLQNNENITSLDGKYSERVQLPAKAIANLNM